MHQDNVESLVTQWQQVCKRYDEAALKYAYQLIEKQSKILVDAFYQRMMSEADTFKFLNDDLIETRLKDTLKQWLFESFGAPFEQNYSELIDKQFKIGDVHARVGIPTWLIIRGMNVIKSTIFDLLQTDDGCDVFSVMSYMVNVLSFTSEIMCRSYEAKVEASNDMKHTYRLFSAMQDVSVQKDKQRSTLLDWENDLMFKVFSNNEDTHHAILSKAEFGLWFIHKAAYAFANSEQVSEIVERIQEVDQLTQKITKRLSQPEALAVMQQIRAKDREILNLVDLLFQVSDYISSGNDSLTQLLNRRYLNTIIARETKYSRNNSTPLSILAIDVDYFKRINDKYGHATGDLALQSLADIILEQCRGSDYAFRIGGEEFLLVQVDTTLHQAHLMAEKIRHEVEQKTIYTTAGLNINFTLSIGVVQYDGHPDYQRFLDAADTALYAAKNNGRNQVFLG